MRKLLCYFGIHHKVHFTQELIMRTPCCDKEIIINHDRMLPNRFKCKLGMHNLPTSLSKGQPVVCADCGRKFKKVVTYYE